MTSLFIGLIYEVSDTVLHFTFLHLLQTAEVMSRCVTFIVLCSSVSTKMLQRSGIKSNALVCNEFASMVYNTGS